MKLKDSFHLYAIITIIFWSLAYVLTRLALQYFSAFSLGFLRYFIASCTLAVIVLFAKIKLPKRKDLILFLFSGAFGFFLYMIAFNKGSQTVTASTGSVMIASVPVITALLAKIIYREQLKRMQWMAIAIEFAGILVLTLISGIFSMNVGLIWLFFAALLLSGYNLLQRRLTKTYSALQASTYSIFFGTVMLSIFMPLSLAELKHAPPLPIFCIVILGIFSSTIAYVSWSKAFEKASKTSSVSNYMFVTPFLTSLFGFVIANERPDFSTVIGGAIILTGLLIFNLAGNAKG